MADPAAPDADRQSTRFLLLYALAVAGGAVAYVPFLTILLPAHVTGFAGGDSLTVLAHIAFAGAIAASIANIGFGWLSDLSGMRRPWIAGGLVLASLILLLVHETRDAGLLILLIIGWQVGLNMMLGPLGAWAGDHVPRAQMGLLGGLMAFAPALGALSGFVLTMDNLVATEWRLPGVAVLTVLCVVPVLLFGRPRPLRWSDTDGDVGLGAARSRQLAPRMWTARLLVQIAEASLFAFLLLWFRSLDPAFAENRAAAIFAVVLAVAVLLALALGRWSDRQAKPIQPLVYAAAGIAAGLLLMAAADTVSGAIAGYVLFGLASSIFLALHSGQTLRALPNPRRRGRDLGLFNLTNTVPSLVMPWLTLALVPRYGFGALFVLLALMAVVAALLLRGGLADAQSGVGGTPGKDAETGDDRIA